MNVEPLLKFGVDHGASAVHLQAGSSPQLRIGGLIRNVEGAPLEADELGAFIKTIAPKSVTDDLDRALSFGATFSATIPSAGRFRCAVYSHIGGPGLVLRSIAPTIPGLETLYLPPVLRQLALAGRGLILVVGPSGSGKTTTLAAMVDLINAASYQKVVTIESPVEYLHANKKALVTQMEVGLNTSSFESGFALALQHDADVIVVGDLCDSAVVQAALGAAESGRKVLAAMSGLFAIQAVQRLIAMIPPKDRETAVAQLAGGLEGVIALRLARTRDSNLRSAVEVLRGGPVTSKAILEGRLSDLNFNIESRQGGMQSLDQHLIELQQSGAISGTEAMRLASNPEAVAVGLRSQRLANPAPATATPGLVPVDP